MADIFALIKNYGVRTIPECGWGSFNGDLASTIAYKFSGFLICPDPILSGFVNCGTVKDINKVLSDNGLTFSF